jgi:protein-disulfide isomerase
VAKPTPKRPAASGRNPLLPFYIVIGVIAVAGVGLILWQMSETEAARRPVPLDPATLQQQQARGVSVGRPDAPVTVMEFADYSCPACAQYASFILPLVKEELVQEGVVNYVFYDFPLPGFPHSFLAARAARCAGDQQRFWEYHDLLFARQPSWSQDRDPLASFDRYAADLGLETREFSACLRSDRHAEEVTRNKVFGETLGINSTPSFIVNGKRVQPRNYRDFAQLIRAEAGQAPAAEEVEAPMGTDGV